jgi:hypothetical protein
MIAEKAQTGVRVRILLGDPDSPYVAERGSAEGIDDAMPADCFELFAALLASDSPSMLRR